jgi:eukaryotic-like serine/threonine-protein kinase
MHHCSCNQDGCFSLNGEAIMPSNRSTPPSISDDSLMAQLLDEFTDQLNAGQQPNVEAFLAQNPEIAATLRPVLEALQSVHDMSHSDMSPLEPSSGDEANGKQRQLGDFRILREIGRGGMGVVYEAEQISLGRTVALKVLPFAAVMDEKAITRFKNEARAAGTLHHPNIVPVHSVGNERGVYYYAMAFINGLALAEVIRELRDQVLGEGGGDRSKLQLEELMAGPTYANRRSFDNDSSADDATIDQAGEAKTMESNTVAASTVRELRAAISTCRSAFGRDFFRRVARIGIEAGEALQHAHEHGIVHRDIKPGNLMIDGLSKLWVTDFGLARIATDPCITMTGDIVGTLRYMAPEQALAHRIVVDHRADVYSLGVTLYELVTLQPAFDGVSREALLRQLAFDEPRPPQQINPYVPKDLATIVSKAMSKSPDERYSTAQAMVDDLRAFLDERPIAAKRPTLLQRASKWSARNKPLVASAAVMLVLSTMGLSISNFLVSRERNEKQAQATRAESEAAITRSVNEFLSNLLAQANSYNEPNRNIRLRDVLDRAASTVGDRFHGQPLVEAAIRYTLGNTYCGLREYQPAEQHLEQSRSLRKRELGSEHPDTLTSTLILVEAIQGLGRFSDAERLARETLEISRRSLGVDHLITIVSLASCAEAAFRLGRYKEAESLHAEVLELRRRVLGNDHPATLGSLNNLANAVYNLQRFEEAESLYREALEGFRRVLGDEHPETFGSHFNLARTMFSTGRLREAESLYKEVLENQRRVLGDEHPGTLMSIMNLALVFFRLGKHQESELLHEEVLESKRRVLGHEHPDTLDSMFNLGLLLYNQERCEEAASMHKEVLETRRRVLGPEHPDTLKSINELASAFNCLGQFEEAESLFKEVIGLQRRVLGEEHPATLLSIDNLSIVYGCWCWHLATDADPENRDPEKATELARLAVELNPASADNYNDLGVALYRVGKYQESAEALEKADAMIDGGAPQYRIFLAMAHWQLGNKERARSSFAEGAAWIQENSTEEGIRFRDEAEQLLELSAEDRAELIAEYLSK